MPTLYDVKPAFQRKLRPLVGRLAAAGVTANQVTIGAMLLSAAAGLLLAVGGHPAWLLILPPVLLLRMALNAVDGMLAREHGQASRLGALLNELGDVVSDACLYLPLALLLPAPGWMTVLLAVLGIIAEMTGVVAVQIGAQRRYDGPLGKSDRAALFGTVGLIVGLGIPAASWLPWLLAVALALACLTILNRARHAVAQAGPLV